MILTLTLTLPSWLTGDYKRSNRRLHCDLAVTRSQLDLFFHRIFGDPGDPGDPAVRLLHTPYLQSAAGMFTYSCMPTNI